ncbi:hypothetical protein M513_07856 [Trichuris suis]|uniref:Uncharacterized protein n=1 Tax=Trichuris suis TaxID=68888 RepID=A0A085M210_9BILA|nr:hypothetical protein M513_07856 [Trichuris suis]
MINCVIDHNTTRSRGKNEDAKEREHGLRKTDAPDRKSRRREEREHAARSRCCRHHKLLNLGRDARLAASGPDFYRMAAGASTDMVQKAKGGHNVHVSIATVKTSNHTQLDVKRNAFMSFLVFCCVRTLPDRRNNSRKCRCCGRRSELGQLNTGPVHSSVSSTAGHLKNSRKGTLPGRCTTSEKRHEL